VNSPRLLRIEEGAAHFSDGECYALPPWVAVDSRPPDGVSIVTTYRLAAACAWKDARVGMFVPAGVPRWALSCKLQRLAKWREVVG